MKVKEIRELARGHGVQSAARLKKPELIRAIQRSEGNFDCFGTAADGYCDQMDCRWRNDCLGQAAAA